MRVTGAATTLRKSLPLAGLVAGAWALLPPYTGPHLNTAARVEVADHVVPGVVLIAVSAISVLVARRPGHATSWLLLAGLVALLAGIWMTATHVPLVAQATRDQAPGGAVLYHTAPGVAVMALGLVWSAAHWRDSS